MNHPNGTTGGAMKTQKNKRHHCGWHKKQDGIYRCGQCGRPVAVRIGVAS